MEPADDKAPLAPPRRSILWAVLALVSGFSLLWMLSHVIPGGPTSNGMTVSEWLNATNKGHIWQDASSDHIGPVIEEFGPEAVPLFIAEFKEAISGQRAEESWISRNVPGMSRPRVDAANIRDRSFRALAILGRHHPELVDPFFEEQLRTTNRQEALFYLGATGLRHYHFFTNLIAGTNSSDVGAALQGLQFMGTNAEPAVPLVFATMEKHGAARGKDWWLHLTILARIGEHHEQTVPTLLQMLQHTNQAARILAGHTLVRMTNQYDRIRPEFVRLASLPITATNDPGRYVANDLFRMGVPPEVGVPILMKRLEYMVQLDGHIPDPNSRTCHWLRWISQYGSNAAPAIKLMEEKVLPNIPESADRIRGPGRLRWEIERSLRRIDPGWTPSPPR